MCGTVGDHAANKALIKVHVKTLTGKTIEIAVPVDATVQRLKGAIEDKERIPVEQQRLVFSSASLEDEKTLEHYSNDDYKVKGWCYHVVSHGHVSS